MLASGTEPRAGRRRGVAFTPMETRRDVIVRTAQLADELGYELVAVPEAWGLDSTAVLAEIALRTRRIRLASGILSVWGRTPATLAMSAATLHQISEGRYVLGLGPSTRALVEGFHDTAFEHPAAKLRDVVTKVRALLAGEPARLEVVPGAHPLRLGQPPAPDLPIWLAAMGDRTLRVAAELGDGWFPAMVARDRLTAWVPELTRLRDAAGRRARAFTVAAGPLAVVDSDPGAARSIAASCTAWYVCAMGDVYARSLTEQGYGDAVRAILAANPRPSPRHGVVPAEAQAVLDQLCAYGTPEQVRDRLEAWNQVPDLVMLGRQRRDPDSVKRIAVILGGQGVPLELGSVTLARLLAADRAGLEAGDGRAGGAPAQRAPEVTGGAEADLDAVDHPRLAD